MKIHLKQIPPEGLHLEGDEECPISELETEEIRCAGPLRYSIDLGVTSGAAGRLEPHRRQVRFDITALVQLAVRASESRYTRLALAGLSASGCASSREYFSISGYSRPNQASQ